MRAFIGIGSNIRPEENVERALRLLAERVHVVQISTLYRTEPLVSPENPQFINGVVEIETDLPSETLKLKVLRSIEANIGRKRTADKYAPRPIDLDLLIYGNESIFSDQLTIPDPEIAERPFVAIPLEELDPDLVPPGFGRSMREITSSLDRSQMTRLDGLTRSLRRRLLRDTAALPCPDRQWRTL